MLDVGQHAPLLFADPRALVAGSLGELRFPEKVPPSVAARRHRQLQNPEGYTGPWGKGPYFVDHLDRIMDCLWSASAYREVGLMGPSQIAKSEIGNNWQLQTVVYDPADLLFIAPDRVLIEAYVKKEFDKMIELTPALQEKMLAGASADTMSLKRFRGADFFFFWPTGPRLRALPFPRIRVDDLDDVPTDISDQGDVLSLARGRMGSFAAFGRTMLYANSSPKLGPRAGIEAFVAGGTDERLWVDCLMCGTPFELRYERLQFDRTGSAEDAAASAAVVCEDCGGAHEQRHKRALLETYRWVGRGEHAAHRQEIPSGKTGELVANVRASFRLDGLSGFRPWREIAQLARAAELALEYEQDDAKLKAFDQTIVGRNYRPRSQGEEPVNESALAQRAKASPYKMGEVPLEVMVLIASIDQQGNRFEVAVWGFGANYRSWLVDRFALLTIEEDGRERPLRPATRPEDWAVIHRKVMTRTWPMAGAPHLRMKLFNTIVDTGGGGTAGDAATDNAFAWWHAMVAGDPGSGRAPIPPTAITLVKGGNSPKAKLLPPPTIDAKRQIKGAPQAELYVPNVNRLKNIADERLNRREDGPGYVHLPNDIPGIEPDAMPNYLAELRAEVKQGEVWMREPHTANETWDLYVYACTVVLRFGAGDASLSWVPAWARPPRGGPKRLEQSEAEQTAVTAADPAPEPAPVTRIEKKTPPRMAARPRRGIRSVRAG